VLLASAACTPVPGPAATRSDAETASGVETGSGAEDVGGHQDEREESVPGLCQASLACAAPLSADSKTDCTLGVVGEDGLVAYDGPASVWIRGRSSRSVPKYPYGVELHDDAGNDVAVNFFGMGAESDWILNGNYYDRALVRNKLGYDLFQSFGGVERYAPESVYCELTIEGTYVGVYLLLERLKRDDDRVVIDDEAGAGLSFVMKQDDQENFWASTATHGGWKLVYPNDATASEASKDGIASFLTAWEGAVLGADPYDEGTGVFSYVDMDSAIDVILLEEFFKNEDFCWTSLHIWKDVGGTVHFSPWDLDMTFGNLYYYDSYGDPTTWIDYRPELMAVMGRSADFRTRMQARWAELRDGPMSDDALYAAIDGYQATMGDSIARNFAVWDITSISYGTYFYHVADYAEEDAWIRRWVSERGAWMDENVAAY
jgi:hypothetical protein